MKLDLGTMLSRLFFRAGFEVVRIQNSSSPIGSALRLIRFSRPDLVIDVGANIGQFAREMLRLTALRVVSFEPLSTAHELLKNRAATEARWQVAPRMALGSAENKVCINIAGNFESSSILPMQESHLRAAPYSAYVGSEEVVVKRLDTVIHDHCGSRDRLYLKIDTQGYESEVIAGADGIMDQVCALQLEVSFVELYSNQKLAFEMIKDIQQLGFKLFGLSQEFQDPVSGELLQANAYFVKSVPHRA